MEAEALITVYVATTAIALLLMYGIIRLAVKHGTGSALRAHEVWLRDGSLPRALDDHAAKVAKDAETDALIQSQLRRERGDQ